MLQRKHFDAIAGILRSQSMDLQDGASPEGTIERLSENFAYYLETECKGKFNREKFLKACGV